MGSASGKRMEGEEETAGQPCGGQTNGNPESGMIIRADRRESALVLVLGHALALLGVLGPRKCLKEAWESRPGHGKFVRAPGARRGKRWATKPESGRLEVKSHQLGSGSRLGCASHHAQQEPPNTDQKNRDGLPLAESSLTRSRFLHLAGAVVPSDPPGPVPYRFLFSDQPTGPR